MSIIRNIALAVSLPALLCVVYIASAQDSAQTIVVDTSHAVNSFSPLRALGGSIDRQRGGTTQDEVEKHTDWVMSKPVLNELLGAGWGTVTYRQNTGFQCHASICNSVFWR